MSGQSSRSFFDVPIVLNGRLTALGCGWPQYQAGGLIESTRIIIISRRGAAFYY
jgi:hypothetical protein